MSLFHRQVFGSSLRGTLWLERLWDWDLTAGGRDTLSCAHNTFGGSNTDRPVGLVFFREGFRHTGEGRVGRVAGERGLGRPVEEDRVRSVPETV